MSNLDTTPQTDKSNSVAAPSHGDSAKQYLRGELREVIWGLNHQLNILDSYSELAQDEMIVFATKQVLTSVRMLREIAKRIDALNGGKP